MEAELSCGTGLAENSVLPAKLAAAAEAMAEVLEVHQKSLTLAHAGSRMESDAYREVTEALREGARSLKTAASRMDAGRAISPARHDLEVLSGQRSRDAFAALVAAKQELSTLLDGSRDGDQQMLAEMRGPSAPR